MKDPSSLHDIRDSFIVAFFQHGSDQPGAS
ncbi:hypothetical protein Pan44_27390 [Caulifigura coniformis]|uniref:Uncharacterized protein n=1 Tax=Caulifigura coniformis TaxID=2527983 RepID=A0A517SEZ2_9PLAN|nr:hypothetical protein Pan44_27390 [Caulifigura coniformis]